MLAGGLAAPAWAGSSSPAVSSTFVAGEFKQWLWRRRHPERAAYLTADNQMTRKGDFRQALCREWARRKAGAIPVVLGCNPYPPRCKQSSNCSGGQQGCA